MKKIFLHPGTWLILIIAVLAIGVFDNCSSPDLELVEESKLIKIEYRKGNFSAISVWVLTFESGTVVTEPASPSRAFKAFFIGEVYGIYYRPETSGSVAKYYAVKNGGKNVRR